MTHQLKTHPQYFKEVLKGNKTFELRKNDRNFKTSDDLELQEFEPKTQRFSGRRIHCKIGYIFQKEGFGLLAGYCIISLKDITPLPTIKKEN